LHTIKGVTHAILPENETSKSNNRKAGRL
jgi:hypothetical protein